MYYLSYRALIKLQNEVSEWQTKFRIMSISVGEGGQTRGFKNIGDVNILLLKLLLKILLKLGA